MGKKSNAKKRRRMDGGANIQAGKLIEPILTGDSAEDFVEFLSGKTFLKPWVFRNSKYVSDNKEFADLAVYFKDKLILFEVKGNKFDPKNPQRYLNAAKKRYGQLTHGKRIAMHHLKKVKFSNQYFTFETDFSEIKDIYLISVSMGGGEMEIAYDGDNIYSSVSIKDRSKYLSLYDKESDIHSFTADEIEYASKHIDTLKDFLWYLDFEKKYLKNEFNVKKGQMALGVVDVHREDLIATYVLTYYWDKELNITGKIDLNKLFGANTISEKDMIVHFATDTRKYLEENEKYIEISKEKKFSYLWDDLINNAFLQISETFILNNKNNPNGEGARKIFEEMSFTSRFERTEFGRSIVHTDNLSQDGSCPTRYFFSLADDSRILFSYANITYYEFPTDREKEKNVTGCLYSAWCKIRFKESFKKVKNRIEGVMLITKHMCGGKCSYNFVYSDELDVDREICERIQCL